MPTNALTGAGDAIIWFLGCLAAGFFVDQVLYRLLTGRARAHDFKSLGRIAEGMRGAPTALGAVIGAAAAVQRLELEPAALVMARNGVQVAAILVVTAFSARVAGGLVRLLTAREDVPLPSGSIFVNLARAGVWLLGGLSLLATLGISIAPLLTALGVAGLAVGLALQPTLENVFSGVQLLVSQQIKPGDFIRLDTGDEGTVLDVTWRNTMVRKASNDVIIVPNSVLARATVTNFSTRDPEFVLLVPVSFASAGDPDAVQRIALEVAREVIADIPEAVPCQEPGAGFAELTPPAAVLNVTIRCRSYQDRLPVRHELVRRLSKRFSEEGIEAPPMPFSSGARRP